MSSGSDNLLSVNSDRYLSDLSDSRYRLSDNNNSNDNNNNSKQFW